MARIWAEDASLWKAGESDRRTITNALGWLTAVERMEPALPELVRFAREMSAGTDRVVVLGMGGSSLAPLVFANSFGRRPGFPLLEVLDSTEPSAVLEIADGGDPRRTLFVVSSKSGSTLEPNIFFDYFYGRVEKEVGQKAGGRFVVVTDPGSPWKQRPRGGRCFGSFPATPGSADGIPRSRTSAWSPRRSPARTSKRCCAEPEGWPRAAEKRGKRTRA